MDALKSFLKRPASSNNSLSLLGNISPAKLINLTSKEVSCRIFETILKHAFFKISTAKIRQRLTGDEKTYCKGLFRHTNANTM